MVRRTVELYECDVCGKDAKRYQITYDEGVRVTDRCEKHSKALEALKEEPGEWVSERTGKATFRKSSPTDIRLALARSKSAQDGAS